MRQEECDLLDDLHSALVPQDKEAEDYLVYRIFDSLTDAWYPVISAIEIRVDGLEAEVFERARREQLSRIYRLRQEVREHHRLLTDQRDQFQPAADAIRNLAGLTRGSKEYLRDVGDHLSQVSGEFHRQYEDLASLAQTYFNANADRLTQTATRLTVVGTLFVTWTLVTGFFGQNFEWLVKHVESRADFLVVRRRRPDRAHRRARRAVLEEAPRLVLSAAGSILQPPLTDQSTERMRASRDGR